MKIIAIPALVMAVLSLYTGAYHLIIFSRGRPDKKNLSFGLLCLAMGLYDFCASGVYNANSVLEASPWQRGQLVILMLSALSLIWFVADYTAIKPKKLLYAFSGYFVFATILHIINPGTLIWEPLDQALIKNFTLFGTLSITYYEMLPGPFLNFQSVLTFLIFAFVFGMAVRYFRRGDRRAAIPLLISLSLLWVGIFNDTFISSGLYQFIYLLEYSFMAIVILMAFSLSNQIAGISKDLIESEERLRSTLQSIDDLVFEISKDGVFMNYPTSEDSSALFLPPDQFIGKPYREILPPKMATFIDNEIAELVASNQVRQFDYPMEIGGETRWFSAKLSMRRDAEGEFAGVIMVSRDITDRKNSEEKIRNINLELEDRVQERTMQLEEKNQELEAFSYSIAHDLRAPLRAINGFSDILLEEYQGSLDQEGQQLLSHILSAGQKMHDLIDSLLSLSQLSRQNLEISEVNIKELGKGIAEDLIAQKPERKIVVEYQFECPQDVQVQADRALLSVLLTNLFSNAIKFSAQRDPALIEFGCHPSKDGPVYFVRDNGIGFDPANAHRMFVPFQRLHGSDSFEGTGIGLAIVERIIKRHNGRIWAESPESSGATFFFSLGAVRKEMD
jgi:PAS domain S-box-containing protein